MNEYIQGTEVSVTFTLRDPDTGRPTDPTDARVAVTPPSGPTTVSLFSLGQITRLSTGVYRAVIDTTPAPGVWKYEYGSTGAQAVRGSNSFKVNPWLAP